MEKTNFLETLLDEVKYRHELYWKLHTRFVVVLFSVFALNFLYPLQIDGAQLTLSQKPISWILIATLVVVGIIASLVLVREYYYMRQASTVHTDIKKKNNLHVEGKDTGIGAVNLCIVEHSCWLYSIFCFTPFFISVILSSLLLINMFA